MVFIRAEFKTDRDMRTYKIYATKRLLDLDAKSLVVSKQII